MGVCQWFDEQKKQRLIVGLLVLLVIAYSGDIYGGAALSKIYSILGIVLVLIGGVCGFIYAKVSHKLSEKAKMMPLQLLAIRFNLMLLCLCFFIEPSMLGLISLDSLIYMLGLTIVGNVLPIFFFQKGIASVGPEKNAIVMAFVPILTVLLGMYSGGTFFKLSDIYFAIILTLVLAFPMMKQ